MAGCSEGALCRPGRPQSVHANAQRAAGDRSVWLDAGAVLSRKRPCAGLAISIPDATLRSRSVTPAFKIGSGIKIVAFGNQNCCVGESKLLRRRFAAMAWRQTLGQTAQCRRDGRGLPLM